MGKPGHRRPQRSIRGGSTPCPCTATPSSPRHVLDRSGRLATETVAEILARAVPPDRRRPCAPGRKREIAARDADCLAVLIAEEAGRRERCPSVGGRQRARGRPTGAPGARPGRRCWAVDQAQGPGADAGWQAKRAVARLAAGLADEARNRPSPAGYGTTDQAAGPPTNGIREVGRPGGERATAPRRHVADVPPASASRRLGVPQPMAGSRPSASKARLTPHGPGASWRPRGSHRRSGARPPAARPGQQFAPACRAGRCRRPPTAASLSPSPVVVHLHGQSPSR
jgi:hypothetical protein